MPPDTAERRPVDGGGAQDAANVEARVAAAANVRCRRAASWRLPPPETGRRDPLDQLAGLPITDRGDYCGGMYGDGGKWQPCCRGAA
jgi:hypothetical protein